MPDMIYVNQVLYYPRVNNNNNKIFAKAQFIF